jgi:hypothetical protein
MDARENMPRAWSFRRSFGWRRLGILFFSLLCSCEPSIVRLEGVIPQKPRALELWNRSKGYVVFRVSTPDSDKTVTTDALPPGGEFNALFEEALGLLCPEAVQIELFAYNRANPNISALTDEELVATPTASTEFQLRRDRHFGCRFDSEVVNIVDTVFCDIFEVDETGRRISYQAGAATAGLTIVVQTDNDRQLSDPPTPEPPRSFPLIGRVIDETGAGAPSAAIRLVEYDLTLLADDSGRFEFNRPAGAYSLEASLEGFEVFPRRIRAVHRSPQSGPVEFVAWRIE